MPKKVSESQKNEISKAFIDGASIKDISKEFNFSAITIGKQLKNILGEDEFEKIKLSNSNKLLSQKRKQGKSPSLNNKNNNSVKKELNKDFDSREEDNYFEEKFFEVIPINTEIDIEKRKDLSSEPIENANLPKIVYMLVDKNIELKTKSLKEYPEWSFLSEEDQNRQVIQIFSDQKFAKRVCSSNQKLIKVPNPKVFLLASDILKKKGISRIVLEDVLLAL